MCKVNLTGWMVCREELLWGVFLLSHCLYKQLLAYWNVSLVPLLQKINVKYLPLLSPLWHVQLIGGGPQLPADAVRSLPLGQQLPLL